MKLVNFYAIDGIRAGLVRPEGFEDLAASGVWQGPAPVTQNGIKGEHFKTGADSGSRFGESICFLCFQ